MLLDAVLRIAVGNTPDLDLVALLLSFLTNYKTPYIFALCILSTLNCSVRPHILNLCLFKSL